MSRQPQWIVRVDDRLVHGQVCVGWCDALGIHRLVLADDEIAASEFERDLYACCPAAEQSLEFLTLAQLAPRLSAPPAETTLAVLADLAAAETLLGLGAPLPELILGGLHHQPGARELANYLYLTPDQEAALRRLAARGVHVVGQPLPDSPRLEVNRLL
jgi:mannose/fructose/N-acetylgalactosamine-specific phosphotransferase system component IIB